MIAAVVIPALQIIAAAAPGLLAAMTQHTSDADAIAHAQKAIDAIPSRPAGTVIAEWRKHLEQTR